MTHERPHVGRCMLGKSGKVDESHGRRFLIRPVIVITEIEPRPFIIGWRRGGRSTGSPASLQLHSDHLFSQLLLPEPVFVLGLPVVLVFRNVFGDVWYGCRGGVPKARWRLLSRRCCPLATTGTRSFRRFERVALGRPADAFVVAFRDEAAALCLLVQAHQDPTVHHLAFIRSSSRHIDCIARYKNSNEMFAAFESLTYTSALFYDTHFWKRPGTEWCNTGGSYTDQRFSAASRRMSKSSMDLGRAGSESNRSHLHKKWSLRQGAMKLSCRAF